MMRNICRNMIIVLVLAMAFCSARAETVSRRQATELASIFFNAINEEEIGEPVLNWNGRQLTTNRLFPPFYVFNHPKGGYIIISAESKAFPILAYSRIGKFDRTQLSDFENMMLRKYAMEIELIRYDSRPPVRAWQAWQNLKKYVAGIIESPYVYFEMDKVPEKRREAIEFASRSRFQIIMPSAIEFALYDPENSSDLSSDNPELNNSKENQPPFLFMEKLLQESKLGLEFAGLKANESLEPKIPKVESLGDGHFMIYNLMDIVCSRIFKITGEEIENKRWNSEDCVSIDISEHQHGYYVCLLLSSDGSFHSLKLYR